MFCAPVPACRKQTTECGPDRGRLGQRCMTRPEASALGIGTPSLIEGTHSGKSQVVGTGTGRLRNGLA